MEVSGQLVTPQKHSHASPRPAPKEAGSPPTGARTQPSVAPVKKAGAISPPLYPAPSVTEVKRSLQQEGLRAGFSGKGPDHNIGAGAVIRLGACQKGQQNQQLRRLRGCENQGFGSSLP